MTRLVTGGLDDAVFMTFGQAQDLMLGVKAVGHNHAFYARYFDLRSLQGHNVDGSLFNHDEALLLAELDVDKVVVVLANSVGVSASDLLEVSHTCDGSTFAINRYIDERRMQRDLSPHQLALASVAARHQKDSSSPN